MLGVGVVNTLELAGTSAALVWKKCWVNACFPPRDLHLLATRQSFDAIL